MKLQNIAIGQSDLQYRNTISTYNNDTSKEFNLTNSYTKNHLLPMDDTWNDDDPDLDNPKNTGNLIGIIQGQINCLTLTPIETNVFNPGTNNSLTQSGTYVGRVFNNYVYPESSSDTAYMWGFETYVKLTSAPASDKNLILYGFSGELGTSAAKGRSRYQISINANRQLCLTYCGRNSSGKWTGRTINTAIKSSDYGNKLAIGVTSAMNVNTWYHLCLARLCDGDVYHGYHDSMMTLVYLQPISNIATYNTHYLNRTSYNKSTSTWTFPTNSVSGTTTSFDNSIYNYDNTNFVCSGGATSEGWFGRLASSGTEQTTAIDLFKICDSGVNMAGGIYIKGGTYYQSEMTIDMDKTTTNPPVSTNGYSKPTITINNSNAFTTTYQYKKSISV